MSDMRNNLNGHDSGRFRSKFKILFAVLSIMLCLLIIRLWHLQVIRGDELSQKSENNSVRLRKIRPLRGLIMDTNGYVLVDNQPSFDILFMPNRARNIQDVTSRLRNLYEERSLAFSMDLPPPGKKRFITPVKLEKNINRKKLAVVETNSFELPGIAVEVVPIRQYLSGESMAHIIGYTGEVSREDLQKEAFGESSIGDITGKYGIEKYLDPYLKGKSGAEQVEVNVLGKEIIIVKPLP